MSFSIYYNKITSFQEKYNQLFSTFANHLIVIFAFFVPVSMTGRKSAFFLIFLAFLLRGKYIEYIKHGLKDKLVQAFLIYFLVHIIWLVGTENLDQAKRVIHEAKFLLYPLLFITLIDKKFIPRIFSAFFLGMLFSELWSYGIFFEILPPHIHEGSQGTPADPTPVFHHTHYGFMLAVTLTLVLQRFFYGKDPPLVKAAITFFFITATINIFITAGRTGYVLYIVLLLVLFLVVYREKLFTAVLSAVSIILITVLLAYNFSSTFHARFTQTITSIKAMYFEDNYQSNLGARAALIINSKDLVSDVWITGVGTGDHMDEVRKHIAEKSPRYLRIANHVAHLHNEYFSAIVQFGVLGLISFLYIIVQLIRYPQDIREIKNMQIILAVAIALFGFIDIVVHGLGAILVLITLVSLSFRNYATINAKYIPISLQQLFAYTVLIVVLELVSWVT